MDMSFFEHYIVITIVGICMAVGYVIKTSLDFIPNKYIPLIMLVLGTSVNVAIHFPTVTPEIILAGMVSGLASTGGYEVIHQFIKTKGDQMGTELLEGADEEDINKEVDDDASN